MMNHPKAFVLAIAVIIAVPFMVTPSLAANPYQFSYSGQLVGGDGKPKSGKARLEISFYHPDEQYVALKSYERDVSLKHGTFTFDIDELDAALRAEIFGQGKKVTIGIRDMVTGKRYPQQRITAVPYALYAERIAVDDATFEFGSDGKLIFKGQQDVTGDQVLTFNKGQPVWKAYSPPVETRIARNSSQITVLEGTIGDDASGLVKKVADNEIEIGKALIKDENGKVGEINIETKLTSNNKTNLGGTTSITDSLKVPNDTNFGTATDPRHAVTSSQGGVQIYSTVLQWTNIADTCTASGDSGWLTTGSSAVADEKTDCAFTFNSAVVQADNYKVCNCTIINPSSFYNDDCAFETTSGGEVNPTTLKVIRYDKENDGILLLTTVAINCFVK